MLKISINMPSIGVTHDIGYSLIGASCVGLVATEKDKLAVGSQHRVGRTLELLGRGVEGLAAGGDRGIHQACRGAADHRPPGSRAHARGRGLPAVVVIVLRDDGLAAVVKLEQLQLMLAFERAHAIPGQNDPEFKLRIVSLRRILCQLPDRKRAVRQRVREHRHHGDRVEYLARAAAVVAADPVAIVRGIVHLACAAAGLADLIRAPRGVPDLARGLAGVARQSLSLVLRVRDRARPAAFRAVGIPIAHVQEALLEGQRPVVVVDHLHIVAEVLVCVNDRRVVARLLAQEVEIGMPDVRFVVAQRVKGHAAVGQVCLRLQDVAIGIQKLERELPVRQIASLQQLPAPRRDAALRVVFVAEQRQCPRLQLVALGILVHHVADHRAFAIVIVRRHLHGVHRIVIGIARAGQINFRDRVAVGHAVVRVRVIERAEADAAGGRVVGRAQHRPVRVLQLELELVAPQRVTCQLLRRSELRTAARRVGVRHNRAYRLVVDDRAAHIRAARLRPAALLALYHLVACVRRKIVDVKDIARLQLEGLSAADPPRALLRARGVGDQIGIALRQRHTRRVLKNQREGKDLIRRCVRRRDDLLCHTQIAVRIILVVDVQQTLRTRIRVRGDEILDGLFLY